MNIFLSSTLVLGLVLLGGEFCLRARDLQKLEKLFQTTAAQVRSTYPSGATPQGLMLSSARIRTSQISNCVQKACVVLDLAILDVVEERGPLYGFVLSTEAMDFVAAAKEHRSLNVILREIGLRSFLSVRAATYLEGLARDSKNEARDRVDSNVSLKFRVFRALLIAGVFGAGLFLFQRRRRRA
ncbi:hypothetical protein WDW37_20305 [Bdellovibrionota bacterium FG-1]